MRFRRFFSAFFCAVLLLTLCPLAGAAEDKTLPSIDIQAKAALLLDRLNKRRDEGLTTPKQIRCLEKYGFQHVGTWSFEAARHMIDRIAAQGWRGVPKGVNPRTYTPAAEPPAADSPFDFGW